MKGKTVVSPWMAVSIACLLLPPCAVHARSAALPGFLVESTPQAERSRTGGEPPQTRTLPDRPAASAARAQADDERNADRREKAEPEQRLSRFLLFLQLLRTQK